MMRKAISAGCGVVAFVTFMWACSAGAQTPAHLRIVVFGAHCDDPESGAGGLIAKLTQSGHEVICAYGATHRDHRQINGEDEDPVRQREANAACQILGATPKYFPYQCEDLWANQEATAAVGAWLAEVKPDIVVAHWPFDTHPNHCAVSSLAWLNYQSEGGWNLYLYEVCTDLQSLGFRPELYLDIESVLDIKKKAVDCHVSQKPEEIWRIHDAMQARRGTECGCTRAEAYFLVQAKPGCPLLPCEFIRPSRNPAVAGWATARIREKIGRGLVALPTPEGGVYVGWRLLAEDPPDLAFQIWRQHANEAPQQISPAPVVRTTDFVDAQAPRDRDLTYWVLPIHEGQDLAPSDKVLVRSGATPTPYLAFRLQDAYTFQKAGIADLNGDGKYDFVLKQPADNIDPYKQYWQPSPDTYKIEAYLDDGTFLWRKDLGWAIERGIWYSPYVVFDLDGDGKAEVAAKTGAGDPRDPDGHVQSGAEYVSIWDGLTGEEKARLPWHPRFSEYNMSSRNQMGIAYLDGKTPCLLTARGTYGLMRLAAFQYHDGALDPIWQWNSMIDGGAYLAQGAHFMHTVDLDGDGRDEVVLGSCVIDDNGQGLWTTGLGHPDHCYVGDINPRRPGLEIYYGIERSNPANSICLADALTGQILWGLGERTTHIHNRGLCADIDARQPGLECWSGERDAPKELTSAPKKMWLHAADGTLMGTEATLNQSIPDGAVYWDADPQRECVRGARIYEFDSGATITEAIEGDQVAWADILGDWREEIITSVAGELRIYTTTMPASDRRVCLMQDALYRQDVAHLAMAYPQIPMTSFCLAEPPAR